jgi:hypothetical protein
MWRFNIGLERTRKSPTFCHVFAREATQTALCSQCRPKEDRVKTSAASRESIRTHSSVVDSFSPVWAGNEIRSDPAQVKCWPNTTERTGPGRVEDNKPEEPKCKTDVARSEGLRARVNDASR